MQEKGVEMKRVAIDPKGLYYRLKLPKKINGCSTIGDIAALGCTKCGRKLNVEASMGFGSLWCTEHGCVWQWIPSRRGRRGYVSRVWKNHITRGSSAEWKKRFPEGR